MQLKPRVAVTVSNLFYSKSVLVCRSIFRRRFLRGYCLKLLSKAGKPALLGGMLNPFPNLLLETAGTSGFLVDWFCP